MPDLVHIPSGYAFPRGVIKRCFPTFTALLLALLVCVVIPTSLIAIRIAENPRVSPIDEAAQFDYVSRMADASMPRLGQYLLPSTLKMMSCTGMALEYPRLPPCPGTRSPRSYPGGGYQYEAQQPPSYYAITVPFRWIGVHLFGMSNLTASRAPGVLWVSAGLLALWMAGCLAGIPRRHLIPALLFLATAPVAIYHASIVSNDIPTLFAGSVVAFLGVLAWRSPGRWTAPTMFVAAAIVTSFKLNDVLAVLVVSCVLAIAHWTALREEGDSRQASARPWLREWGRSGGMLLAGAALMLLAWTFIDTHLNLVDPRTFQAFSSRRQGSIGFSLIARESIEMLNPLTGSYHPFRTNADGSTIGSALSLKLQSVTATLTELLFLSGALAGLVVRPRKCPHWLGVLSLVVLYVGGLVLGFVVWRTYKDDPGVTGRYGLCVAPLLALALASSIRRRWAVYGLWVFSLATLGLTYTYLLAP